MKYKLLYTLYTDIDYDYTTTDKCYDSILFAKKGMVFELFELTEELREEHNVWDEMWKYIFLHKSGKYLLSQDGDTSNFELIK